MAFASFLSKDTAVAFGELSLQLIFYTGILAIADPLPSFPPLTCCWNRYDIPLDRLTLTATHNSFSSDRNISTHANFEVTPPLSRRRASVRKFMVCSTMVCSTDLRVHAQQRRQHIRSIYQPSSGNMPPPPHHTPPHPERNTSIREASLARKSGRW